MFDTETVETAPQALAVLAEWRDRNPGEIAAAILEWAQDAFDNDEGATARDVLRHLETIDCAGCHAPRGLIYNQDVADKLPLWWSEIDEAMNHYFEETGEHARPRDGSITLGWMVWFAVEWVGHDAASYLSNKMGV